VINTKQISQHYRLYKTADDPFLTQREAECVVYLLRGLTTRATAETLQLSHRTVEFYLTNIKEKLACVNKTALIVKIENSDFKETASAIIQQIEGGAKA
jgi:DNA-binding CsgD family transcriptional regulator